MASVVCAGAMTVLGLDLPGRWQRRWRRGAEEKARKLTWQALDDLLHLVLETLRQDTVGLVDDQALQVLEHEALGVLQVV